MHWICFSFRSTCNINQLSTGEELRNQQQEAENKNEDVEMLWINLHKNVIPFIIFFLQNDLYRRFIAIILISTWL